MSWKDKFPKQNIFYQEDSGILYKGDALKILKTLPDESIDCIITSPPYWSLRDYGEETNIIWGGDKNCKHEFEIKERYTPGQSDKATTRSPIKGLEKRWKSGFCKKCGAWYGQLGLEPTLDLYLEHMLQITAELKRVLKKTGIMFWNHGNSYNSHSTGKGNVGGIEGKRKNKQDNLVCGKGKANVPDKCMTMQNYRLILRMIDEQGWILRNIIIWHKPNHMPESVKDRFTKSYEPVFMLVKNKKYWFDLDAVRVPHKEIDRRGHNRVKYGGKWSQKGIYNAQTAQYLGQYPLGKNPGDVWTIPTQPFPEAHFAVYPEKLVEPMVKAGCPQNGIVLDPFIGSGTTAVVAKRLCRNWIGIDLNRKYCEMAKKRISKVQAQPSLLQVV